MRVLYVAPRYHTNQIPIMKGWIENGHEVMFVSQVTNASENHDILNPVVLGYSRLFRIFFHFSNILKNRTLPDELFAFSSKRGFPPYIALRKIIKGFKPDVAILRERSLYTVVAYHICRTLRIPSILYNQSPYWELPDKRKSKLKKIVAILFPRVRMTPVLGMLSEEGVHGSGSYYVPFVMEPYCRTEEKEHFKDEKIQILCVAGYHDRKRLPLLLDAVNCLKEEHPVHLSIVGEVITPDQREYFSYIQKYVEELHLEKVVTLKKNYKREQVFEEYVQADLFVLPSTRERASISQLEAMSCGLPIICSDTNGAACQIEQGINGYLFRDESLEDLIKKIELAVCDRERLVEMGQASYKLVKENYSFRKYYQGVLQILSDMKKENK